MYGFTFNAEYIRKITKLSTYSNKPQQLPSPILMAYIEAKLNLPSVILK